MDTLANRKQFHISFLSHKVGFSFEMTQFSVNVAEMGKIAEAQILFKKVSVGAFSFQVLFCKS